MVGILPITIANSIFGALLIAACLTSASWGLACVQFYNYFTSRSSDHWYLKYTMIFLVFINTLHTVLVVHIAYYYLVLEYGNPKSGLHVVWSETVTDILIEFSDLIIRLLFARRVWLLSQGNVLATVIAIIFVIPTFGCAMTVSILLQRLPDASLINDNSAGGIYAIERRLIWSSFAFSFAAELTLTCQLCYYLYTSRTGFKRTNSLIKTLMVYTIHTGLFILIGSTIATIAYFKVPNTNYTNIFYFMESSLYVNAYLAGLSARDKFKNTDDFVSLHLSQINPSSVGSNTIISQEKHRQKGIHVSVDQSIEVDTVLIGKTGIDK